MGTYTQILYQIVFSTKHRERTLLKKGRTELFKFITGILKNKKCHLYAINGVEDHIHIITHLHPIIALSSLVKDIKVASSVYIKQQKLFPNFKGWQNGYSAFTYTIGAKKNLIRYVQNQEEHHRTKSSKEELIKLLNKQKVDFKEAYLD